MKFDKTVVSILENFGRDVITTQVAMNKQLTHNLMGDPKKILEFIYKTPGMYGDLLAGRMDQLTQKFKQFGVDAQQISSQIEQARKLVEREKAGQHVSVKRALPVNENTQMDYYFEDLYNITDDKILLDGIRKRLETPELKEKLGPANVGNAVEMVFKYIKDRQKSIK